MAHAWKVCRRGTVSRVRIPLSPPAPCLPTFRARNVPRRGTFGQGRALSAALLAERPQGRTMAAALPAEFAFVDSLPVAAFATDTEGRVVRHNAAAAALWGRSPAPGARWSGAVAAARCRRCAARRRGGPGGAHPGRGRGSPRGWACCCRRAAGRRPGGLRRPALPCCATRTARSRRASS